MCSSVGLGVCAYVSREAIKKKKIFIARINWGVSGTTRREETEVSVSADWGVGSGFEGWGLGLMGLVVMVTGFGSTAACCPFARPWWAARWCPPRCSPETRHELIDQRSASVIRCDRSLQNRAQELSLVLDSLGHAANAWPSESSQSQNKEHEPQNPHPYQSVLLMVIYIWNPSRYPYLDKSS